MLQNLSGNHPNCWDKRGIVKKALPIDQRLTLRNRKHIRRFRSLSHQNPLPDLSTVAPTANCSYRHDSRWLLTIDDGRSSSRVIAPGRNANGHSRCTDTPDRQSGDHTEDKSATGTEANVDNQSRLAVESSSPSSCGRSLAAIPQTQSATILTPPTEPLRKSARINKQQTTKYSEYVTSRQRVSRATATN